MSSESAQLSEIQAVTRVGQDQQNIRVAEAHMAALNTRNLQAIGETLHPAVRVVGPAGVAQTKESFLDTYHNVFTHVENVNVLSRITTPSQTAYVYSLFFAAPIGEVKASTVMTHHEDGQIKKIEMAFNTADLEQYLNSK